MSESRALTFPEKRLLIIHLVRDLRVTTKVLGKLKPEDFDEDTEFPYRLIWDIASKYYVEHRALISGLFMANAIETFAATDNTVHESPDLLRSINSLVLEIYRWPAEELVAEVGISLAQRFVDERRILNKTGLGTAEELIRDLANEYAASRIAVASGRIDLMNESSPFYRTEERDTTGLPFLDYIMGGGTAPGEVQLTMGPSGGGKTLLSLQQCATYSQMGEHVMYFSYEQPVIGGLSSRVYSFLTGTSVNQFRGKDFRDLPKETQEKYLEAQKRVGPYLHFYDFCGTKAGHGGPDEIANQLYIEREEGRSPKAVFVDWLHPMVSRYMMSTNKSDDSSAMRSCMGECMDRFSQMASEYNTVFWVVHQLTGAAAGRKPTHKPHYTEAAEAKSLAWLSSFAITIGVECPNTNCCWLVASKARHSGKSETVIRMRGEYNRFEAVRYSIDRATGGFQIEDGDGICDIEDKVD